MATRLLMSVRDCAFEAAYHHRLEKSLVSDLFKTGYEFAGRMLQNYPGEFIELRKIELSRYPNYKK